MLDHPLIQASAATQRHRSAEILRVLEEGYVEAGDTMHLVDRESHGVTVAEAGRVAGADRNDVDAARRILAVDSLGSSVQRRLNARVASHEAVGLDAERLFGDGADTDL